MFLSLDLSDGFRVIQVMHLLAGTLHKLDVSEYHIRRQMMPFVPLLMMLTLITCLAAKVVSAGFFRPKFTFFPLCHLWGVFFSFLSVFDNHAS